jgi:hypothetical protein|tara:strand:- start:1085 stop:1693 length:609 start_codon:yes stop_codon:yes gene_type:complete
MCYNIPYYGEKTMSTKAKAKPHYVDNKLFSQSVVEYVESVIKAKEAETDFPKVTDYIAKCFIKISEGLSHRPNFVRYTYREEMVMDGVENCLRAIGNYNIETATRTGKPNAFSYFTQICFFAFIRRITKEKKQQDIKFRFIEKMGIDDFVQMGMDTEGASITAAYVDELRTRISQVKTKDEAVKVFAKEEKAKKQKLELFMV